MNSQPSTSLSFFEVDEVVRGEMDVVESLVEFGVPTFIIPPTAKTKEPFIRLYNRLKDKGLMPVLRMIDGRRVLKVLPFHPPPRKPIGLNVILFLATLATVTLSGYLQTISPVLDVIAPGRNIFLDAFSFSLGLLGILTIHEAGHKIACKRHGIKSSLPYFIPGPPQIGGTFGAMIKQETPPINRDQLFDLGLSGPLLGFITIIPIAAMGLKMSYIVNIEAIKPWMEHLTFLPTPILFDILYLLLIEMPSPPRDYILFIHPLAFASWVGFIVTFLNIMPIAQLDGGHVARSILGFRWHKLASLITVGLLFISGYWPMAMLGLMMIFYLPHPGPLDDVSKLDGRKMLAGVVLMALIAIMSYVALPLIL